MEGIISVAIHVGNSDILAEFVYVTNYGNNSTIERSRNEKNIYVLIIAD